MNGKAAAGVSIAANMAGEKRSQRRKDPARTAGKPQFTLVPPRAAGAASPSLWLHLHFPRFALEAVTRGVVTRGACVLVTGDKTGKVLLGNARAAALGVRPGMPLGAALALGDLTLLERSARAEQQALDELCLWAMQWSPKVSPVPADGLLLEIRGSLKLFRGFDSFLGRLRRGLKQLGYRAYLAVAPTPLAATLLARSASRAIVTEAYELHRALAALPITLLRLEPARQAALQSIGITCLGDCRRLSRSGLARRLSPQLVDLLDRLYGQVPDPRPLVSPPPGFNASLELPWEVEHAQALTTAGERLLHELVGYLQANDALTRELRWRLIDRDRRCERLDIRLTRPGREHAHMLLLFRERLLRMHLQAPVRRLELAVDDIVHGVPGAGRDLFGARPGLHEEAYTAFVDRLRSRCGEEALRGLGMVPDHRPEHAWRWQHLDSLKHAAGSGDAGLPRVTRRPVWLVKRPLTLPTRDGRPQFDGPLRLLPERERIDTGWWDGPPSGRDYFVATTPGGSRLWIYKELTGERRWRLHGVFE